jgi:hypothetical protein
MASAEWTFGGKVSSKPDTCDSESEVSAFAPAEMEMHRSSATTGNGGHAPHLQL